MRSTVALFASLFFVALASGGAFVVWLVYNPAAMAADFWISSMQHAIRVMNPLAVVLNLGLLFTVISAVLARRDRRSFYLLLAASICLVVGLGVTVAVNWPINHQIKTWNAAAPPSDWMQLRDRWWTYHRVRAVLAIAGLACAAAAALVHGGARPHAGTGDAGKDVRPAA